RAGYELFYTPVPADEKRAAKTLIDVGFDRLGDGVGAGFVRLAGLLAPAWQSSAMLSCAIVCSAGALLAARRLHRGYLGTLASSLVDLSRRDGRLDSGDDAKTVNRIRPSLVLKPEILATSAGRGADAAPMRKAIDPASLDPEVRDIL